MKIEEVLIELGEKPLYKCAYSKLLIAVINSQLSANSQVTKDDTGYDIIGAIYTIRDEGIRDRLLQKEVHTVRERDSYKQTLVIASVIVGCIIVSTTMIDIIALQHGGVATSSDVFNKIIEGGFDILKIILTNG